MSRQTPEFRIKVCGITTAGDARMAASAGVDAVGLNFYPKSARYLPPENARAVVDALPVGIAKVGLFVNADVGEVCQTFDRLGLDLIQLHGDEPPEVMSQLGDRPVIRAFRLGPDGLKPVAEYIDECRRLDRLPRLVLLDAYQAGSYGGTGRVADWRVAAEYPASDWHPPLVLAGGLTAEKVGSAIRAVRPAAVDTASGVESTPGHKDPALVEAFVREARQAFAAQ